MRRFLAYIVLIYLAVLSLPSYARTLTFSSFNIAWYGLGGNPDNDPSAEYRDEFIKQFIAQNLGNAQVLAFQEIVDVERLKSKVLGQGYSCVSYDHSDPKHQHVVLCAKAPLRLIAPSNGSGFTVDEVGMGRYRPAVRALVTDAGGRAIADVYAVHLKANDQSEDIRRNQIRLLSEFIRTHRSQLPVTILGDFNTESGEEEVFGDIMTEVGSNTVERHSEFDYTFRNTDFANKFDRVFTSRESILARPIEVFGPCNRDSQQAAGFENLAYYNRNVSDHCPIKAQVTLSPQQMDH